MMGALLIKLCSVVSLFFFLGANVCWFDPAAYASDFFPNLDVRNVIIGLLSLGAILGIAPLCSFVVQDWQPRRRFRQGHCVNCGYDLRGTPLPRCSECGSPVATSIPFLPRLRAGAVLSLTLVGLVVTLCTVWEHIPGTLRQDRNGSLHDTGALKLVERVKVGVAIEHTWYKPGGSVIASTKTPNGTGVGYYVRNDGTIRVKMEYVKRMAHGPAVYYNRDGSVRGRVVYKNGSVVEGTPPPRDDP